MVFADFFVITFKKFTIEFYKKIKFESRFFSLPDFYIERLLSNFFLREQTSARNTDSLLYLSCQKQSIHKKIDPFIIFCVFKCFCLNIF